MLKNYMQNAVAERLLHIVFEHKLGYIVIGNNPALYRRYAHKAFGRSADCLLCLFAVIHRLPGFAVHRYDVRQLKHNL